MFTNSRLGLDWGVAHGNIHTHTQNEESKHTKELLILKSEKGG